jgi:uncharacterized RDD family membrane protein YckC
MFSASLDACDPSPRLGSRSKFVIDNRTPDRAGETGTVAPPPAAIDSKQFSEEVKIGSDAITGCGSDQPQALFPRTGDTVSVRSDESWRAEVAARLDRYRSRRKQRAPRYPSLRLKFDALEPGWSDIAAKTAPPSPANQPIASPLATAAALAPVLPEVEESSSPDPVMAQEDIHAAPEQYDSPAPESTGKIIEFPRYGWPPPQRGDELAEPVMTQPRILDVPEVAPPPPALGGMLIETEERPEEEKRPGIDIPLQSAPIEKRLLATAIDGIIVLGAAALFGYIVFRLSHPKFPLLQIASLCAGLTAILWACYQYAFLVYSGTTPGLRCVKLRLSRFDGRPVNQSLRRWRVLVSFLSAASLGMGYAWHFMDEDALCWHDRMTHTYIGPAGPPS